MLRLRSLRALVLFFTLAAISGGCSRRSEPGPPIPPAEARGVKLVLSKTRMRPGEQFSTHYEVRNSADRDRLTLGPGMDLTRRGKIVYTLVMRLGSSQPPRAVRGVGGVPTLALSRGEGPYLFRLPTELDRGEYALCGWINLHENATREDIGDSLNLCRVIKIV